MNNQEQPEEPLSIEQEYELWRSNVPLMYDFVSETKLTWPSLTLQWLPGSSTDTRQHIILGTHTSEEEQNYLKIAALDLPEEIVDAEQTSQRTRSNIKITKKFKHDGEITRARYMPQDSNIIATINGGGKISVYDRSKDMNDALISTFEYHQDNGYGLSFNPSVKGELLSCSDDSTIALWDISKQSSDPISSWTEAYSDVVNDCKWHEFEENLFGSVSEDSKLLLHDKRSQESIATIISKEAYNTLAFSKHSTNLFAAAGTDSNIYLYDRRNISKTLHVMAGHEEAVSSLEFYGEQDGILLSGSSDRRAILWDLAEIGAEQQPDEADDGCPELLMIHAGHRSAINDISIHPSIPWLMASVEEENVIQVWKCSKKLQRIGGTPSVYINMLE